MIAGDISANSRCTMPGFNVLREIERPDSLQACGVSSGAAGWAAAGSSTVAV